MTPSSIRMSGRRNDHGPIFQGSSSLLEFGGCFRIHRFLFVRTTQPQVCQGEFRTCLQDGTQLGYGLVVAACVIKFKTHVSADGYRQGIEFVCTADLGESFLVPPASRQQYAVPVVGGGVVWVHGDRPLEFLLRTLPIPVVIESRVSQGSTRLGEPGVNP